MCRPTPENINVVRVDTPSSIQRKSTANLSMSPTHHAQCARACTLNGLTITPEDKLGEK